ncbi:MAG TPA: chemotaxis protein CheA [Myxococcota bacterium]|jgi:two-component system chemotaxis sensor kinase CheA
MAQRPRKGRRGSKTDQEFVSEAEEILDRMRQDLADLNEERVAGDDVDPEVVNRLFRSAHSLKGLAGLFGFDPIQDLAHRVEDILDGLRLGRVRLQLPVVALIDEAVHLFAGLLEQIGNPDELAAAVETIGQLAERIQAAREAPAVESEFGELALDPSLLRALTEYEEHRLRENIRRGRHICLIDATFEIISFEEGLSRLTSAIREVGEVLSTLPAPGEAPEAQIRFSLLVASDAPASEVVSRLGLPGGAVRLVRAGAAAALAAKAPAGSAAPTAHGPAAEADEDAGLAHRDGAEAGEPESLKSISDTVRVDIHKLDELMNLVGELVIQRGAIGELVTRLSADAATARIGSDFAKVHKALDRKLRELQSAVLDVRMVPLSQVFEKVSRVVRRLRSDLGKDVRLELRGADTELDKLIVEELVDPLMHVVRNALDHAIEPREERIAGGKDPEGRIRIEAFQRGNHVVIAVSDDGRGIDTASLRSLAEARGVIQSGATLSEREALDLIFMPGISTRSEVTETSGRGVGMDVVHTNLTALGGVVDVDSTPGRGTTIAMTLPITLAIIQSLIVVVARQRFAIPLNAVHETLLIAGEEIQRSEGRELLNLRGEALPLLRLAAEFDLPAPPPDAKPYVVVIGLGESRMGLLVDRLDGQQDTVIKPIQGPIPAVRGIAGATELGDQDPVLVLDVSALLADCGRRRDAS